MIYDPYSLENLRYESTTEPVKVVPVPVKRPSRTMPWSKAYYYAGLEIAKANRDRFLAVMTIVRQRNNWYRGEAFLFGNVTMSRLGFHHKDKIRALKKLETWGFVRVEWRPQKSPMVTVIRDL